MTVGSADLHKAVVSAWDQSTLNTVFKAYWSDSDQSQFPVLHDQEATPAQPFPYCIFNFEAGSTQSRMTKNTVAGRFEHREVPLTFKVHAREFSGNSNTAKKIAADLMEEVLKIFGGHPTAHPVQLTLENGSHIQTTYLNDYGMRDGDEEYSWILRYSLLLDVPVAA